MYVQASSIIQIYTLFEHLVYGKILQKISSAHTLRETRLRVVLDILFSSFSRGEWPIKLNPREEPRRVALGNNSHH